MDGFKGEVVGLARHPYGCRVLQRCLERLDPVQTRPLSALEGVDGFCVYV